MREIVWSSALSAQTAPWPTARAVGLLPTATCASGLFRPGSISTTELGAGVARAELSSPVSATMPATIPAATSERGADGDEAPAEPSPAAPDRGSLEPERGVRGGEQLTARCVTIGLVLGEASGKHWIERFVLADPRRVLLHVRPEDLGFRRPGERRRPREALVQQARERVLVCPPVDLLAADLLGREVVERADDVAGLGRGAAGLFRQPEVAEVRVTALVEEHVRRLDVAVDEPLGVRGVERVRHPAEDRERLLDRQRRPLGEKRLHVAALYEPHRQEQLSLVLARLVDREDVAVVDRRGEP